MLVQEGIIRGRGHADPATVRGSGLLGSLTSSSVLHVHRQQSSAGNAMAPNIVLEAVQQEWQKLMHQRLHAAQLMLPDIPLVAAPRPLDELSSLQGTCGHPAHSAVDKYQSGYHGMRSLLPDTVARTALTPCRCWCT